MGQTLIGTRIGTVNSTTENVAGQGKGFRLGTRIVSHDGKIWAYVQCNSAVAKGDVVNVPSGTNIAVGLTTATSAASETIGVAPTAFASGDYGWVQVYGRCVVSVLGSCVKDVTLYSTTTAGNLDDATASNYQVTGIQLLSTNPTASATQMSAFLSWPKVRILPGVL